MADDPKSDSVRPRESGAAVASLILGILSIVFFIPALGLPGLAGLPLGIIALLRIRKGTGRLTGRGMAIAGIVTSSIPLAFILFLFTVFMADSERVTAARDVYAPVYQSDAGRPVSARGAQPLMWIGKIYTKGDFIFVNELYQGVHVIDNRDPSNPAAVAFLEITGNVDIAVRGNTLYADSWRDLVVVDISDPASASVVRRVTGVFPSKGITQKEEGLARGARFERADKRKGTVIGWVMVGVEDYSSRTLFPRGTGCFPRGTEVLTAEGPRPIETIQPGSEVYACDIPSGEWKTAKVRARTSRRFDGDMVTVRMGPAEVQATGNHPFYVLHGDRLSSRPLPPDVPGMEQKPPGEGRWVEARDLREGDVLATMNGGGAIVTGKASRRDRADVYNLEVEGCPTYAVNRAGILVHNKGYGETAQAALPGKGGSLARCTVVGDYLYVLSGSALKLFSIRNPADPAMSKSIDIGQDIETIFAAGDTLFIGGQEGVYIYDNRDPAEPRRISRFVHATSCDPVVVQGGYAYVTLRGGTRCGGRVNRLDVIDISSLASPKLLASLPMENPSGLGIDGDALFICDGSGGLKILDASDPRKPEMAGRIDGIHPLDVILDATRAVVVARAGLYQYDYRNLRDVVLVSRIPVR